MAFVSGLTQKMLSGGVSIGVMSELLRPSSVLLNQDYLIPSFCLISLFKTKTRKIDAFIPLDTHNAINCRDKNM